MDQLWLLMQQLLKMFVYMCVGFLLVRGGVLKKGQVGLLEGKGAEAVVPLERNTQWISKVAAMMVQMLGTSGQAVNVTIPVYVGGKHLSTVVLDDVNQTEKKGRDPVTATA